MYADVQSPESLNRRVNDDSTILVSDIGKLWIATTRPFWCMPAALHLHPLSQINQPEPQPVLVRCQRPYAKKVLADKRDCKGFLFILQPKHWYNVYSAVDKKMANFYMTSFTRKMKS